MRALSIALLAACLAWAGPDTSASTRPTAPRDAQRGAVSIGAPNEGRLDGGIKLEKNAYVRVVPYYADSRARWGLPSLVGLIEHAARHVAVRYPGSVLGVGDLSLAHGGALARHRSHESGRDADIGFYLVGAKGKPVLLDQFVPVEPDGTVRGQPGVRFDDDRNWALIESLLEGKGTIVSQVFVAPHIRARLLRHAERMGLPRALRERAAARMQQPRGTPLHDDHFHIRIGCPPGGQRSCLEYPIPISVRTVPRAQVLPNRQRAGNTKPAERSNASAASRANGGPSQAAGIPQTRGGDSPSSVPSAQPTLPGPVPAPNAPVATGSSSDARDDSFYGDTDVMSASRMHETKVSLPPGAWSWDGGAKSRRSSP